MRMHPPIPIKWPLTGPLGTSRVRPGRLKQDLRVLAWLIRLIKSDEGLQQTQGPFRFVETGLFVFAPPLSPTGIVVFATLFEIFGGLPLFGLTMVSTSRLGRITDAICTRICFTNRTDTPFSTVRARRPFVRRLALHPRNAFDAGGTLRSARLEIPGGLRHRRVDRPGDRHGGAFAEASAGV